jgi:hypothetical protein
VLGGDFVSVRNGSVVGMGSDGIRLRYAGLVEDVLALSNGGSGIAFADQAIARGNRTTGNGGHGILGTIEATIDRNSCVANHLAGIFVTSGVVLGNTATRSGNEGANLGSTTTYADNLLGHNPANPASVSVTAARATGGNSCDDQRCSPRGRRRFYLERRTFKGDEARLACAPGYHMATLWEIYDPSSLEYDTALGFPDEDGSPEAARLGWLATGGIGGTQNFLGQANCSTWLSASPLAWGSLGELNVVWSLFGTDTTAPLLSSPWDYKTDMCDKPHGVWCVQD